MNSTFGDEQNSCTFCTSSRNKNVLSSKNADVLQFDLKGNDTTLYIRETSVSDVSKLNIKTDERIEDETDASEERTECSVPTLDLQSGRKGERTTHNQLKMEPLDLMHVKKWSGKTYFEEELRKIQTKTYNESLEESLKRRKMWKDFQRYLTRERKRDLVRTSGPGWWQEPSSKQICLAMTLGDVIKADFEEEVTGRTRQWLLDLGVTTRVTPKEVRSCLRMSLLQPVDFLLEIHRVVLNSRLKTKKKKGEFSSKFSTDEKILLSAVCVLHLPTLLTMLHFILPLPKPWSTIKHVQELLFGDLDDERIRFFTPYMEPLPFRDSTTTKDLIFTKVLTALIPSLNADESLISNSTKESIKEASPKVRHNSFRKSELSQDLIRDIKASIGKIKYGNSDPSVSWLISQCIENRMKSESVCIDRESEPDEKIFYSRNLSVISRNLIKNIRKSFKKQIFFDESTIKSSYSKIDTESNKNGSGQIALQSQNMITDSFSNEEAEDVCEPTTSLSSSGDGTRGDNILTTGVSGSPQHSMSSCSRVRKVTRVSKTSEVSNIKEKDPKHAALDKIREEVQELAKKEQLLHAIKLLAETGDPLARLPKIHQLPTLQRWFELRRGKNRILSKEKKNELLSRSRGLWKVVTLGSLPKGPKVKCSKKTERLLTWDKKNWLSSQVNKEVDDYFSRVRREKVDNARTLFPTMLNAYDYGSKLNRSYRDVFYTYLPSREADTFVYKPWQPSE